MSWIGERRLVSVATLYLKYKFVEFEQNRHYTTVENVFTYIFVRTCD
jgi:hypothetical protein